MRNKTQPINGAVNSYLEALDLQGILKELEYCSDKKQILCQGVLVSATAYKARLEDLFRNSSGLPELMMVLPLGQLAQKIRELQDKGRTDIAGVSLGSRFVKMLKFARNAKMESQRGWLSV